MERETEALGVPCEIIDRRNIKKCLTGERRKCGGYQWKYA